MVPPNISMIRRILIPTLLAALFPLVASSAPATNSPLREAAQILSHRDTQVGWMVPDLELVSWQGKKSRLSDQLGSNGVVIALVSASCPVSKRYAPTLRTLEKEYAARGFNFIFLNPIASESNTEINTLRQQAEWKGLVARDPRLKAAGILGARTTTEVFLLDRARTVNYRGAVDDQYGLGFSLPQPRRKFLAEALESTILGKIPAVMATTAPGCALETAGKRLASASPVTFHNRVSRILQQHCQECHHAGGVAPFSLESFSDATSHAGMMRKVVEQGIMPPWFAAPTTNQHSPWINDRTLLAEDKRDLLAWIENGKPQGKPSEAPLKRVFAEGWKMGKPDAIIQIPEPIAVQASGKMPYKNVYVETSFGEDRWVQALEVRPTARDVVHHVLVMALSPSPTNSPPGRERRRGRSEGGDFFAAYVPGNNLLEYSGGFAKRLPAGATLHFQIHYTPTGVATQDQTRLGLIFSKEPPKHEVRVAGILNNRLKIPPGADDHQEKAMLPVPFEARLLSFMPHMHLRGKAFRYELQRPDGSRQLLLDVPRYDFNWQLQYILREPVEAPAGSQLLATAWYDNSTNNPANPDPMREVKWGPQTDDEMMLGYVDYYVPAHQPGEKFSLTQAALRDGGLLFNVLDKNRDGKITIDESPTPDSFRKADGNADGVVTLDELRAFLPRR